MIGPPVTETYSRNIREKKYDLLRVDGANMLKDSHPMQYICEKQT